MHGYWSGLVFSSDFGRVVWDIHHLPSFSFLREYTWPGSNWRSSACEAAVIATRPQVLTWHFCTCDVVQMVRPASAHIEGWPDRCRRRLTGLWHWSVPHTHAAGVLPKSTAARHVGRENHGPVGASPRSHHIGPAGVNCAAICSACGCVCGRKWRWHRHCVPPKCRGIAAPLYGSHLRQSLSARHAQRHPPSPI